jgi:hypothetical protein
VLAAAGLFWLLAVYAVLRPGGVWPIVVFAGGGVIVWQYVESLRIVLTSKVLVCKQFGITRWSVERNDVEFTEGSAGAYGGFPALLVHSSSGKKQVGAISRMQFRRDDLAVLQQHLVGSVLVP